MRRLCRENPVGHNGRDANSMGFAKDAAVVDGHAWTDPRTGTSWKVRPFRRGGQFLIAFWNDDGFWYSAVKTADGRLGFTELDLQDHVDRAKGKFLYPAGPTGRAAGQSF